MPLQFIKISAGQVLTIDNTNGPVVLSCNPPLKTSAVYTAYYIANSEEEKLPITLGQNLPQYTFPTQFLAANKPFSIQNTSDNDMTLAVEVADAAAKARTSNAATKRKLVTSETQEDSKTKQKVEEDDVVEKKATKKQKTATTTTTSTPAEVEKVEKEKLVAAEKEKQRQIDEARAPVKQLMKLPNGLQYKDEEIGRGAAVLKGSTVAVRYQGMLTDGRIFDSNMPKGQLLTFTVGAGHVVPGFEQGVVGMRVGGKRRVIIPSQLGYGREGTGPIPPNATLVFDITMVKA